MRSDPVSSPQGFSTVSLKTLAAKVRAGATPNGGSSSYLDKRSKFVLVRSQNVLDHEFAMTGLANISDEQAADLDGARLEANDVLLNITGDGATFGRACLVPAKILPACVNQHVVLIRTHADRCVPGYLAAWLALPETKPYIESFNAGGSRRAITKGHIESFEVPLPPIAVQEAIATLAENLNTQIETLRETNSTLEAIAQAIFKSWFIDFDPVKAKSEGRIPDGIDEATAALFPDSFEESALGAIPKGWTIDEVGNVADCVGGGTPSTKEEAYWEPGTHHWVTPKDLSGLGSPVLLDTERKLSPLGIQKVSSGLLPKGTLLLSSRAPIGYLALAQIPLAVNQGFIAMKPGGRLPPEYLYFWTASAMVEIKQKANGSTFMEISKSAFRPIKLVVPEARIVQAFQDIVGTIFEAIEANESERRTLTELRDTLLPRLISGKLKLPELQEVAEAL